MGLLERITAAVGDFATENRGWFVIIFVLPFSLLFDVYFELRSWVVNLLHSAPELHEQRVKNIQKQLRDYQQLDNKKKLCTARGGWQSISPSLRPYKDKAHKIEVNLFDILDFDEKQRIIKVEPMVNMGQLSKFLIPKGYTLPVLPEMDDLTVGGLLIGVGIETSSHKFGLFNDSVVEAEVVLASGELKRCSWTENSDIFHALPWSYGTLGFLTSVSLKVIECKPYVKIWFLPCKKQENASAIFKSLVHKKKISADESESGDYLEMSASRVEFDFVESLMFSRGEMVAMPAKFCDVNDVDSSKLNSIGLWYKEWFFKHVVSFLKSSDISADEEDTLAEKLRSAENVEEMLDARFRFEFIPLRQYYHRHTKSIFWELEEIIPFGNSFWVRWLLGWALPPKVSFLKLTQTQRIKDLYEKSHVIQDMMVPEDAMDASLDCFEANYGIYPLWICPYRAYDYARLSETMGFAAMDHRCFLRRPEKIEEGEAFEMYVDLGAYGIPRRVKEKKAFDIVETSRKVERFVEEVKGFQMLYATSYQSREEFRRMFNHVHYDRVKKKVDPQGCFPEVYEKVCKRAVDLWK